MADASVASTSAAATAAGAAAPDAAETRKEAVLKEYRKRVKEIQTTGRAKPDMVAYKELKGKLTPPSTHGQPPGVRLGEVFHGKGELAILGIHKQILRGIDCSEKEPNGAYAIVLSGGYGDDTDDGLNINYTGEGGQAAGKQATSQEYKGGNLALRRNHETGTPVRVCRAQLGANKERQYVYEGLYRVVKHKQVASKDNAKVTVISFELKAVEGEAVASTKVTAGIFKRALTSQLLAGGSAQPQVRRPNKRKRPPSRRAAGAPGAAADDSEDEGEATLGPAEVPPEALQQQREALLDKIRVRRGLLNEDISGGCEALPIPLFNETDDPAVPPPDFEYIADYRLADDAAVLARASCDAFARHRQQVLGGAGDPAPLCGRRWMGFPRRAARVYQPDGRLKSTQPLGLLECAPCCTSAACRRQAVCTRGVRVPLEVFYTGPRGWGVRVAADVAVGTFLCCYVGAIILDSAAEQLRLEDAYLFSLDHFVLLQRELEDSTEAYDVDPSKMPTLPPEHLQGEHLVVDARTHGNVARFINHSCQPNCVLQTLLMREAQGALYYYVGVFTQMDLTAGTEVTYSYGYATGTVAGRNLPCHCGAPNCTGRIL